MTPTLEELAAVGYDCDWMPIEHQTCTSREAIFGADRSDCHRGRPGDWGSNPLDCDGEIGDYDGEPYLRGMILQLQDEILNLKAAMWAAGRETQR